MNDEWKATHDYSGYFSAWYVHATELGIREFCEDLRQQIGAFEASFVVERLEEEGLKDE